MNFLFLLLGFTLLIFGGNWLLKSAVDISLKLRIPKIVIGMTVVSFATSAPELIVSIQSAMDGYTNLAVSNVIGSNIANLGFVLGITLLVTKIHVEKSFYLTDWPAMITASLLLYVFTRNDNNLGRMEGVLLFIFLIVFLVYLLKFQKQTDVQEISEEEQMIPNYQTVSFFMLGALGLWGGSELLIYGVTDLGLELGISERIIGITIISIGTSIPELAASLIAVFKKEKAISLGNLIGSNIFNILAVLGITAMIKPIFITDNELFSVDIYWMLGISFLILPLVFIPRRMQLETKGGLVLLLVYLVFLYQTIT